MRYGETDGRALLDRMAGIEEPQQDFNPDQVNALIEVFIPRFVETCPGMAGAGLKCKITRDPAGWDIRIDR